ncbi:MAG: thioredoxin [Candidatus Aminicenantes bacterium]|jgi:thioredoxin 1|nr:thioredoxin [Candidatus Aminicenantes bacterium]
MSEEIVQGSDATFEQEVLKSEVPVLVDFWAPWCMPCRMIAPAVEEIAKEHAGKLKMVKVNVDDNPKTSQLYGILSIPTLILFKGGEVKETVVGVVPKKKIGAIVAKHV